VLVILFEFGNRKIETITKRMCKKGEIFLWTLFSPKKANNRKDLIKRE